MRVQRIYWKRGQVRVLANGALYDLGVRPLEQTQLVARSYDCPLVIEQSPPALSILPKTGETREET